MSETEDHLPRVRRICLAMPDTWEKLSHGAPTFFVKKSVFAMYVQNHHSDGHIAVWLPVPPGEQPALIAEDPATYYHPPYVGVKGWVGIELSRVDDETLGAHLTEARRLIANKTNKKR